MAKKARSAKQKANDRRLGEMARARAGKRGTSSGRGGVTVVEVPSRSAAPAVTIVERGRALAKRGHAAAQPYLKAGKLSLTASVKGALPSVAGGAVFGKVQVWLADAVSKGDYKFLADADATKQARNVAYAVGLLCCYAATKTKGNIRQAMQAAPAVLGYLWAISN